MPKIELRELIESVDNPHYDKRRKVGESSFSVFSQGSRFLLEYHDEHSTMADFPKKATLVQSDLDGALTKVEDRILVKLFFASSRVVEPKTVEDLIRIHGIAPKPALEELLATGKVKVADIDKAMSNVKSRIAKDFELNTQKKMEAILAPAPTLGNTPGTTEVTSSIEENTKS